MFFRILKRDLKRKRTMNLILLLFILLASMFLASSVNNLAAITGAVDHFIEISNVPDLFVLALTDGQNDPIRDFLAKNENVKNYEIQDSITVQNDQIQILQRKAEDAAAHKNYERSNTLSIQPVNDGYMKVFDENGKSLVLHRGEIALAKLEAQNNDLQVGDRIAITVGKVRKEFTVVTLTKDAVFGTSFIGFKRNMISQEDFEEYAEQDDLIRTRIYNIDYKDKKAFEKEYKAQKFNVISGVEGTLIPMCYVFDMVIAGALMLVSICLILIAFLVLRFTISFTLQEDYKEIGIMKAIGLRDQDVRGVYLVKYFGIATMGAVLGFFLSIPFQEIMLRQAVVNVVVEKTRQGLVVNLLAAVFVVLIVLLFCSRCIGRLKKISAIEAIRNGSTGERFSEKHLKLHRHKKEAVPGFLALNDVVNQKRRFLVLLLNFILGTLMILLPLTALTTLQGEDIIYSFGVWKSDLYLESGQEERFLAKGEEGIGELKECLKEIEELLAQNSIEAHTGIQLGYVFTGYATDEEDTYSCQLLHPVGEWEQHLTMLSGREPVHPNEIAITEISAEKMGAQVGDHIFLWTQEGKKEYLITGTYQTMMNMGEGLWLPKSAEPDPKYLAGIYAFQIALEDPEQKEEAIEVLQKKFPDGKIYQGTEWIDKMCGLDKIREQVASVMAVISLVVFGINALLTVLMVRTFLTKERSDIALLKSLGFSDGAVRRWQTERILLVLAAAIVCGAVLAKLLAPVTVGQIFGMMGAKKMKMTIDPFLEYLFYPLLMALITGTAAFLSTAGIRSIDTREVNNIE